MGRPEDTSCNFATIGNCRHKSALSARGSCIPRSFDIPPKTLLSLRRWIRDRWGAVSDSRLVVGMVTESLSESFCSWECFQSAVTAELEGENRDWRRIERIVSGGRGWRWQSWGGRVGRNLALGWRERDFRGLSPSHVNTHVLRSTEICITNTLNTAICPKGSLPSSLPQFFSWDQATIFRNKYCLYSSSGR